MDPFDIGLRRAHRHLEPGELVVTSLAGVEAEGRRRRTVVMTDRRLVVVWWRGGAPLQLPLAGTTCRHEPRDGRLTLTRDGQEVALRAVDESAARAMVNLFATRREGQSATAETTPPVRLLP